MRRSTLLNWMGWIMLALSWLPSSLIRHQPSPWGMFTLLAAFVLFSAVEVLRAIEDAHA